jgi:HlyD family secretion protein
MELSRKMRRIGFWLVWGLVLATAVVLLKKTVLAPPQVTVASVERRDLTAQVYGNGTVEAKVLVSVSATITARVVALAVDQGDQVTAGQLLARLEEDDFRQQEHLAQAGLDRVTAGLAVEEANLHKAQANLALAGKNAQRFRALVTKDLVSRIEAEGYETSNVVAKAELSRCQAALDAARQEQAASLASLGLARSRLADTLIYAPQDGIIISRDLELGATVTPGLPLFTLADPRTVWLKANVDEAQLAGVAVGKEALITLRSAPGKPLPGQVARLGRQSDRVTEELEVDVAFSPPLSNFRLGEQSDVLIEVARRPAVLAVPTAALVRREGKRGLWLVQGGSLRFQALTVGIEDRQGLSEIVAGLDGKERLVAGPLPAMDKFKDGMKVRLP